MWCSTFAKKVWNATGDKQVQGVLVFEVGSSCDDFSVDLVLPDVLQVLNNSEVSNTSEEEE